MVGNLNLLLQQTAGLTTKTSDLSVFYDNNQIRFKQETITGRKLFLNS